MDINSYQSIYMVLSIIDCYDIRPADYDTGAESFCTNTCDQWANGYCNIQWDTWPCSKSTDKIREHCRISCNNCGKYFINL